MAISLQVFASLTHPRSVTVEGITLEIRRLSAAEALAVRAAHAEPRPPIRKDPSVGSIGAGSFTDEDDPAYRASYHEWLMSRAAADLAVASGYVASDGSTCPDYRQDSVTFRAWIVKAAAEIKSAVPRGTLDAFFAEIHASPKPAEVRKDAEGALKN
jgi:hypothetical protein